MGRIHKLLIRSCLKGIAIGWVFLAFLIGFNILGLRDLTFGSSYGLLGLFLLAVGFAITFGNSAMGYHVMRQPKNSPERPKEPDTHSE